MEIPISRIVLLHGRVLQLEAWRTDQNGELFLAEFIFRCGDGIFAIIRHSPTDKPWVTDDHATLAEWSFSYADLFDPQGPQQYASLNELITARFSNFEIEQWDAPSREARHVAAIGG